jgi:pSer/pThr/pTyr-binding forkhead associated (FHA) protein
MEPPLALAACSEFGHLAIMKKDGSEGPHFSITTDVIIGRDRTADIRIKLSSVSREHAQIVIDENGQCRLQHLSKTNPTVLNGAEVIEESILLNDDDEISIGERSFRFRSGE